MIPARAVLARLREGEGQGVAIEPPAPNAVSPLSWRERIWVCPDATRLGVTELCEAVGKPKSWCYRHTSKRSGLPQLPHRRLDGDLVFVASEIREWLAVHEDVVVRAAAPVTPLHTRLKRGA